MAVKNEFPLNVKLSEAKWNAVMDALETNWLSRIADTRAEYQEERMRLNGAPPRLALIAALKNQL